MADFRRLNLRLNMENPAHREAWSILSVIPKGHRTDAICQALLCQREQENMRKLVREVVHEELKQANIQPSKIEEPEDDAVLGFLCALQDGDIDL